MKSKTDHQILYDMDKSKVKVIRQMVVNQDSVKTSSNYLHLKQVTKSKDFIK